MNEQVDIRARELPSLPLNFQYLLGVLNNENISFGQAVESLSKFPDISARLIFIANSAWIAPVTPVQSLLVAIQKIGIDLVKSISISLSVVSTFDSISSCRNFDARYFWCHTFLTADVAVDLAKRVSGHIILDIPTVHTACILQNLGLLWLAGRYPELTADALYCLKLDPEASLALLLRDKVGIDHHQAGGELARYWNFPKLLISVMSDHASLDSDTTTFHTVLIARVAAAIASSVQLNRSLREEELSVLKSLGELSYPSEHDYFEIASRLLHAQSLVKTIF